MTPARKLLKRAAAAVLYGTRKYVTIPAAGPAICSAPFAGLEKTVSHDASTIYGFLRRADGSLGLQSVDVASGSVSDTGARIKADVIHGNGLAARWDVEHGRLLLLTREKAPVTGMPDLARLVSLK